MRGRSPRTREGRIGPTAQDSEERGERSEEREDFARPSVERGMAMALLLKRKIVCALNFFFGAADWAASGEGRMTTHEG